MFDYELGSENRQLAFHDQAFVLFTLLKMHRILESFIFSSLQGKILLLLLLIAFEVDRVAYSLIWHPLARFPGPKIAGAANLYGAYYDLILDGYLCKRVAQIHDLYGPSLFVTLNT